MNNLFPKISIITPSYNQGDYIEETILSVLNQDYPNIEYIIIDGGSSDRTVEIIKKYEDKLTYWISEPDNGQTDAINKGFLKASGDIINWLNSDDYLEPDALSKIAKAFESRHTKAVTSIARNFIPNGASWNELTPLKTNAEDYLSYTFNNQPATFFRKEVWSSYFPLPTQLHYTMDQYLWFCFWINENANSLQHRDFISVNFRRHELSKTSASGKQKTVNTLGESFFNEHHLLFWSLFRCNGLAEQAKLIECYFSPNFDFLSKEISFNMYDSNLNCYEIFDKYLSVLLREDYKHGDFKRIKKLIVSLNPTARAKLGKIEKNLKYAHAIKIYRKIYWFLKR